MSLSWVVLHGPLLAALVAAAGEAEEARTLYAARCASCHERAAGAGELPPAPSLDAAGTKLRRAWLVDWLQRGTPIRGAGWMPADAVVAASDGDRIDPDRVPAHPVLSAGEARRVADLLMTRRAPIRPYPPARAARIPGRTLANEVYPCGGCHALRSGGPPRSGPELFSAGERLQAEWLASYLHDPLAWERGAKPRVRLRAGEREAIAQYLLGPTETDAPAPPARREEAPERDPSLPRVADALYQRHCAPCHGVRGDGRGINAPFLKTPPRNHRDPEEMRPLSDQEIFEAIKFGGARVGKSSMMPAWGGRLSDLEIRRLVGVLRSLTN